MAPAASLRDQPSSSLIGLSMMAMKIWPVVEAAKATMTLTPSTTQP